MITSALSNLSWKYVALGSITGAAITEIIYKRDDRKKAVTAEETETQKCASIAGKFFVTIATLSMTYGNAGYGTALMTAGCYYYASHCPSKTVFERGFDSRQYAKDYRPGFSHYQHHGIILMTGIALCIGKFYWKTLNGSYQR